MQLTTELLDCYFQLAAAVKRGEPPTDIVADIEKNWPAGRIGEVHRWTRFHNNYNLSTKIDGNALTRKETMTISSIIDFLQTKRLILWGVATALRVAKVWTEETIFDSRFDETPLSDIEKFVTIKRGDLKKAVDVKLATETTIAKVLPREYAKIAAMTDTELHNHVAKTRKPGAGRKKTHDIGDKQVKAVIEDCKTRRRESFRAHCAYIIRTMKDGDYSNPYKSPKDLDTAVRRYCQARGIPLEQSTTRTGNWSGTK